MSGSAEVRYENLSQVNWQLISDSKWIFHEHEPIKLQLQKTC